MSPDIPNSILSFFFPFFVALALALAIPLGMMGTSLVLGPKKKSAIKMEPYECGVTPAQYKSSGRLSIKFFVVALLFLVCDIEIVFLYPWAVVFKSLGFKGFILMATFIFVFLAGLVYAWKKGALEWE